MDNSTAFENERNAPEVADVAFRVALDDQHVGDAAWLERPDLLVKPDDFGGVLRCGRDRGKRRQAEAVEQLDLDGNDTVVDKVLPASVPVASFTPARTARGKFSRWAGTVSAAFSRT